MVALRTLTVLAMPNMAKMCSVPRNRFRFRPIPCENFSKHHPVWIVTVVGRTVIRMFVFAVVVVSAGAVTLATMLVHADENLVPLGWNFVYDLSSLR